MAILQYIGCMYMNTEVVYLYVYISCLNCPYISFADLADRSFWPGYVYERLWKFRDYDKSVKSDETQESASPAEQTA